MGKVLSEAEVAAYERDGFLSPVDVLTQDEVEFTRSEIERYEHQTGRPLGFPEASRSYLLFEWADALVRHPTILDAVEDLIGPDILVYHLTIWNKPAHSPAFVRWHQDGKYFFLEPHRHVTAWVALSASGEREGCIRSIPGSHRIGQFEHTDDADPNNMIPRGQGIDGRFDDEQGVAMPLRAGQMSLHHTNVVHASSGNDGDDRRIGFGISYIPTSVRDVGSPPARAMLVRGEDTFGHFIAEERASEFETPEAFTRHRETMVQFRARQDTGATVKTAAL